MFALEIQTWTWNPQSTKGSIPNPRQNAAMVVEDNILYIHGGRGDLIFDDMYVMSTVNFIWIKVAVLVFATFLQIYAHEGEIELRYLKSLSS